MHHQMPPTGERWQRIEEVFARAVAAPPEQRAALLDAACGDDEELRAEVETLLAHDARAGEDFLNSPIVPEPSDEEELPAWVQRLLGHRIGRYTVVRLLGHGGMGCVFEAVQEQPARPVALKVLQPGLSAPSALARFRLEPELLARLRHPNIAQVYEAGIQQDENGVLPYFAMEYIPDAQPLLEYADRNALTTRQRLELFGKVCDAIHHGHQKGIIHRDIKPGNILVGTDGEPKVIDFGVARASDADILMTTQCTHTGDLIGTMQYMSPEQCDGDSREIDTRSDVYSLGVVLYELLTGARPYKATGTTIYAAARAIKEHVPPRLSAVVAQRRALARELRGDIDTVVLKALEKDREKRYDSAARLAADIRRYLNHEPILARPPTRWTRAVRWVARHPYVTTAAACLLLAAFVVAAT